MSSRRKVFKGHPLVLISLITFFLFSCSHLNLKKDSYDDDNFWAAITKESIQTKKSILKIIEKKHPALFKQIQNDSQDLTLLTFWGKSLNFDSGAKKQILEDQIVFDFEEQFGLKKDSSIVHAGVMHTYGYLFSTLPTPYGFKRKRWIEPTLNYAFSLTDSGLSPQTKEGTLLSNLTYFAGRIAFKNEAVRASLNNLKNVSPEILKFDYSRLSVNLLEEEILSGGEHQVTLRSTFVHLPLKKGDEENDYLLIYSIEDLSLKREFLITAFPIKNEAYQKIISSESLGLNRPIVLRYNAYLEGHDKNLVGTRKFLKVSL